MEELEMTLGEHLIELRNRLIISIGGILLFSLLAFAFSGHLVAYFTQYADNLVILSPPEAFVTSIKISLFVGILLALPLLASQFWLFVLPALHRQERGLFYFLLPTSILLFYAGVAFCFYVVLPLAVRFLVDFAAPTMEAMFSLRQFAAFMLQMLIPFGLVFELPLMISLAVRLRLVTVESLRAARKYVIVAIFLVAAILTPPDITTQVLLALPIWFLFEISLLVGWIIRPREL